MIQLFGCLTLLARSDISKDAEILKARLLTLVTSLLQIISKGAES
jgi:hypothetical protein